ncbi:MAG: DUF4386 domain-containing protein [Bacteroidia bacterium]|nr:DUF4386 domain-containing protein [Bacteroidia bacterium]
METTILKSTPQKADLRKVALLTGSAIVIMAVVAGLTMGLVFTPIFELNSDSFSTQFSGMKSAFQLGILGWLVILICDLVASWGLFRVWEGKNRKKSMAMAAFRLIYSLILLVAIGHLVLALVNFTQTTPDYGQIWEQILDFQSIWQFGLILFGVHLLLLAPLVFEKGFVLKAISILLFIAGIGYVASNTADLFIADYEEIRFKVEAVFMAPMVLGELGLAIWLLVKGGKKSDLTTK